LTLWTVWRRFQCHWSGTWWRLSENDVDWQWSWSTEGDSCLPTARVS